MAKKSFLGLIRDQYRAAPQIPWNDLQGKTVLIVGANTGLGFEAALHLARMGPKRVILACRSKEKGEAAIHKLQEATGHERLELWLVDLADFSSVNEFVNRAVNELDRLDILLLNAATIPPGISGYSTTKDGWEITLQVNDLSLSILAIRLLPLMLDTAKQFDTVPRTVIVSSEVHFWTSFDDKVLDPRSNAFEVLSNKEYCTPKIMQSRYLDSKLLNVFFTRAINNRLKNLPLIVNTVNPGFCYSELRRDMTGLRMFVMEWLLARTAEEGSRQLVWAAIGEPEGGVETLRGSYIHLSDIDEPSDFVLGEAGKKREDKLWNDLLSVLERVDPQVKDVVAQLLV